MNRLGAMRILILYFSISIFLSYCNPPLNNKRDPENGGLLVNLLFLNAGQAFACNEAYYSPVYESFRDLGDGTISANEVVKEGCSYESKTLIWRKCAEGQTYNSGNCQGNPREYAYRVCGNYDSYSGNCIRYDYPAIDRCSIYNSSFPNSDWRVPKYYELKTLLKKNKSPAIDTDLFPVDDLGWDKIFISSSVVTEYGYSTSYEAIRVLNFNTGYNTTKNIGSSEYLRCVTYR